MLLRGMITTLQFTPQEVDHYNTSINGLFVIPSPRRLLCKSLRASQECCGTDSVDGRTRGTAAPMEGSLDC